MVSFNDDDDHRSKKQRTSKGKQKIKIKKIEKKESRSVAFSKRRLGLFKKCSELCSLYGSEFAVVAFSIAGKPFVSGYPSADEVIQRFVCDSRDNVCVNWWDNPVDGLELDDLERFKTKLEGLMGEVTSRVNEINRSTDAEINDCGRVDDRFCDYNGWLENVAPQYCPVTSGFNRVESFDYQFPGDWMENGVSECNLEPFTVYGSCSLDLGSMIHPS